MTEQNKRKRIQGKDPNFALRYFKLGTIRARKGKYYEAFKLFKKALKIKPEYAEDLHNTALVFSQTGKYELAIKLLNIIIELNPQNTDVLLDLGDTYHNTYKYNQAVEVFNRVLELQPQDAAAYYGLGVTYNLLMKDQDAIKAFKKVIEIKPRSALAYFGLGTIYYRQGRLREAGDAFKQVFLIDPDNAGLHFLLGSYYFNDEKYDKAIDEYAKSVKLSPQNEIAFYYLGLSYVQLEKWEEASEVFEQGAQIWADGMDINCLLGITCVLAGDIDKAIKPLERAFELGLETFPAFYFLGYAYGRLQRYKEAVNCFEKAIEINPNDSASYFYLGASLFGIKQYDRAVSALQIAKDKFLLESNQEGAALSELRYLFVSGIINWAEKKYEEARTNFLRASQILVGGELDEFSRLSQFLYELIPIDTDFEKLLLSSKTIETLTSGIIKLSQKLEDLLNRRQKSELSHPLIEAKTICILVLTIALVKKEESPEALEKAIEIFHYGGFRKLKMAAEALERFIYDYIKFYKEHNGKLSEGDEATLLNELKQVAALNGTLSRSFGVRQFQEVKEELFSFKKGIEEIIAGITNISDKAQSAFRSLARQAEVSSSFFQKEDVYEVYITGRKEVFSSTYINDTLRKNKAKYDLWIDQEKREVRVKEQQVEPGTYVYKLLVHISKNVGTFCTRSELFKAVWGYDHGNDDPHFTSNLQKMFSRYIYKYGGGILKDFIKGEKSGYRILDNLNSCLIVSPISKHSN